MKLLKKVIPLISFFALTITVQAFALPVEGDTVNMGWDGNVPYTMTDTTDSTKTYQSFCLESENYFDYNTVYTVASVGDTAFGGGGGVIVGETGDPVSDETRWLYAAYFDGNVFGSEVTAQKVQNAIWAQEVEDDGDATDLSYILSNYYTGTNAAIASGWTIRAVNLTNSDGDDIQSQLVGSLNPVPEPTTILLFGTGLIGLVGVARRRKNT